MIYSKRNKINYKNPQSGDHSLSTALLLNRILEIKKGYTNLAVVVLSASDSLGSLRYFLNRPTKRKFNTEADSASNLYAILFQTTAIKVSYGALSLK